jgi:F-type H+-transporting ATPase subunit delta
MESVIAEKYAVALLQVAKEQKKVGEVTAEIQAVQRLIVENPSLRAELEHPRGKALEKMEALHKALARNLSKTMENFLQLLISKKRVKYLQSVAEHYERLCYESQGKSIARVVTAMELTPAQKLTLADKLSKTFGTDVELREEIRPQLIGGMIVYLGDQRMDGSILGQLEKMKQRLLNTEP